MIDPIVEEIRATRRRVFAECGGDFDHYLNRINTVEPQDKERLVTLEQIRALAEKRKHTTLPDPAN